METIMENPYLQTSTQNHPKGSKRTEYPLVAVKQELASTLYRKVSAKSEVKLTRTQLYWATYLFKQYDLSKPGWLRTRFVINQRRRKQLNKVLWEAGVDGSWCGPQCANDEWSGLLHTFWHTINGVSLCS